MSAVVSALFVALVCAIAGLPLGAFNPTPAAEPEQDPDYCYICRCKCGSKAHR